MWGEREKKHFVAWEFVLSPQVSGRSGGDGGRTSFREIASIGNRLFGRVSTEEKKLAFSLKVALLRAHNPLPFFLLAFLNASNAKLFREEEARREDKETFYRNVSMQFHRGGKKGVRRKDSAKNRERRLYFFRNGCGKRGGRGPSLRHFSLSQLARRGVREDLWARRKGEGIPSHPSPNSVGGRAGEAALLPLFSLIIIIIAVVVVGEVSYHSVFFLLHFFIWDE